MTRSSKLRQGPLVFVGDGPPLVEGQHDLEADLACPGVARRLIREALFAADRNEWVDTATLVLSEVVTNATLHAHTGIQLWFGVYPEQLCVEVRDFNPSLPAQRDYDLQATTGRGMALVSTIAKSCGVQSLGEDGKVVWFCVADEPAELDADALLAAWDIDELLDPATHTPDVVQVMLPAMPATLWFSARQHHDAIIRELVLYLAEHDGVVADVPAADTARAIVSTALVAAVAEAHAAGRTEPALPDGHPSPLPWVPKHLDLAIEVPADGGPLFAALQDTLDAAERLAVEGKFLIRPALPEIVAVRDWACEQVIAQLAGNAPSPWPGTDQERFEREINDRSEPDAPDWDPAVVTEAATGAIAADDANRILAISKPLATALGWDPAELVGRRVVTVIPPALREGHVAGFSRYLTTGEAHVLGVPLHLPVLRRDGTEIVCRFLVEQRQPGAGRSLYIAWIDPIDPQPTEDHTTDGA